MIKKFVMEKDKDWDKLLPYLLFGYREVPHASTSFSPLELLYGRSVRGPLDALKGAWEGSKKSFESVVSHILQIREMMDKMSELAQDNLKESNSTQKKWYDQHARERTFENGDKVLVLIPSPSNKLFAQWQGPYTVVQRIGQVSYKVDTCRLTNQFQTFLQIC